MHIRGWLVLGLAALWLPAAARGINVELNLLYVHGVKNCTAERQNAEGSLADLQAVVDAALPGRIATFQAAHPGVTLTVHSAAANLYTATPSGIHPSDSPDPLDMDDWEVGDPGCSASQQGDPCTTAYEWRYRLRQEIERLYPAPARNIILIGHSSGARAALEVAANVGPSGAINSYDWGEQDRIAGVMTVHGMLDAIGDSTYNVVGITSFETACKNGDAIVGFGNSCAPGNGWCEYAGRVDAFPAADWVAQQKRALMLTGWGSCSPSAWTGRSDGSLPYDAQGSPLAVGLDMTPAPGQTWRPAHGELYGSFCHSDITNSGNAQHAAARDAARQRLLDWLFVAAPRVASSGTNATASLGFNQSSATFTMGASCPAGTIDDTLTAGSKGLGVDVVGVCHHPGFFDGDDHSVALSEITVTNGATCNGSYRWQQSHDSGNNHSANLWWKTRAVWADAPDLAGHLGAQALAQCGDGELDPGEACDDGNTDGGDCCSATCEAEAPGPCSSDGNPCTTDACNGTGECRHTPNSAPCDDGVFCNGADTCSGGACGLHAGDPCSAGGECNRTCNEAADSCAAPAGSACTDDGNGCTDDRCNGSGACAHPANSAPCTDGLFCNGADTCSGGACGLHAGDPCAAGVECNRTCNEAADSCAAPAGSACTDDGNGCTDDRCNGTGACTHPNNSAPCTDGLYCNGPDTCSGGTCAVHAGDPCSGNPECARTCNEAADHCFAPTGTACSADSNGCTDDVCDGGGVCTHPNNSAPCDDGNACTVGDACAAGTCVSGPSPPCGRCAACDPALGCVVRPQAACRTTGLLDSMLRIRHRPGGGTPQVLWKWKRGGATAMSDFGDPEVDDDYTFCLFDESTPTPALLFAANVPGGKLCQNISCWRRGSRTLTYKDRSLTPEGIGGLRLQSGADGKSGALLKGKGINLVNRSDALPVPPLPLPLRAQLQAADGACWEATYGHPAINADGLFKGSSE
ncbi:MAG: hypothetical protein SF182_06535 [Deltaproteobacteria bacterium]|nr:hypothetical protein [Deltaproteobacteria bacterium]